ncbi:hypothetical protein QFC22_003884 [Naganishia vaughanmartiniae]|uniref:Uncharacterized protein n=1 Tax=Naganishia vaughanmartiniae TaxID=1424756 RepID=A0ACC2X5P3_9TREE|nr:hypothetical protein QFC22_003884 [Naganishia vaughanmartiniae]
MHPATTPCTPLRPSPTPQQPRYSHPYGIQSTSSGVLSSSRGTSSPNTVISTHSYQQHKSSQSIKSLLRNSSSVDDLASNTAEYADLTHGNKENVVVVAGAGKYDSVRTRKRTLAQRASMSDLSSTIRHESPGEWELDIMASPRKKVAEMREVLMHRGDKKAGGVDHRGMDGYAGEAEGSAWRSELEKLSRNPEVWTTAELATFVYLTLLHDMLPALLPCTTAGSATPPNDVAPFLFSTATTMAAIHTSSRTAHQQLDHHSTSNKLPVAVVDDIKRWILRKRVDGRAFLKGAEGDWCSSEGNSSPPFLAILLSLSKNLCRMSAKHHVAEQKLSTAGSFASQPEGATYTSTVPASDLLSRLPAAGVLQESDDENAQPGDRQGGVEFQLPVTVHGIEGSPSSHVRRVVDQIDGHLFNDLRSPSVFRHYSDEDDDLFPFHSGFARYRPRTTSTASSLHSAISALSMTSDPGTDNDDDTGSSKVMQRALQFERGHVGRHVPKTAEEREGRVLDDPTIRAGDGSRSRDCRLRSAEGGEAVELEAYDVFGDAGGQTITPRNKYDTPTEVSDIAAILSTMDLLANSDESRVAMSRTPPRTESTYTAHEETTTKEGSPKHMSRMAQHEKAGLKPYGALRRAHTSPMSIRTSPAGSRQRGGEFPRLPTMGMVFTPKVHASVVEEVQGDATLSDVSQSLLGGPSKNDTGNTLNLFDFEPPSNPLHPSAEPRPSPVSPLRERLSLAEARIRDLERALAEVLEGQRKLNLGKTYPAGGQQSASRQEDESKASSEGDEPSANTVDKLKVTIADWVAWISGVDTTPLPPSSSASSSSPIPLAMPASFRQIPGYVFLVGVGLSVIVVRTVFLSPYTRSNR